MSDQFVVSRRRLLGAMAVGACPAWAQSEYPSRNVSVIVPYTAGGASDVGARIYQPELSRALGQAVVVENVAGAGGAVGVMLLHQPAVGLLDLVRGGICGDAQHRVAARGPHRPCQRNLSFFPGVMFDLHPALPIGASAIRRSTQRTVEGHVGPQVPEAELAPALNAAEGRRFGRLRAGWGGRRLGVRLGKWFVHGRRVGPAGWPPQLAPQFAGEADPGWR